LEISCFSAICSPMMMRDYKFRQNDWPRRRTRGKTLRTLAAALALVALGLLGFAGWQMLSAPASSVEESAKTASLPGDPRVIPLAIPPARTDAGTTTQGSAAE
jgi:hypothetical protein